MTRRYRTGIHRRTGPGRGGLRRIGATFLALGLVLAACGGGDGSASGEDVELTVWFARDYYAPPDAFESFHDEYPHINVTVDIFPSDDILDQLLRMQSQNQKMPDVVQIAGEVQSVLWDAGVTQDLTEMVERWEEEDPELFAEVYPIVWEQGTYDGAIAGMANTAQMPQLFYRVDLFEAAGLDGIPGTWEDFFAAKLAIKQADPSVYPYAVPSVRDSHETHLEHGTAMGMEIDDRGVPDLTSEAGLYWIEYYQRMMREGIVHPDVIAHGNNEIRANFISGAAAIMADSIGKTVDVVEAGVPYGEEFLLGFMPLSRDGSDQDGEDIAGFRSYVVAADAPSYEASLVLRYLMQAQQVQEVTAGGGDLPRTTTILENEEITGAIDGWSDEFAERFVNAVSRPADPLFNRTREIWDLTAQDIYSNPDMPAEELAAKWQAEFDAAVE